METRLQGLFSGCEGRRKGRAAYMFQYSRQFFPLVFLRVPRGRRRSDQVWFALSLASIIDRECLSVWRKDWTKNESCSFFFFLLPALIRMGHYTLITNIPQISVTKTVQFSFLQHIATGGGLWFMTSVVWSPSCWRLLHMEFHRSQ